MITQYFLTLFSLLFAGMIVGISFIEAWAKFRTPGLTKGTALAAGKTVFGMFQRFQWLTLLILIIFSLLTLPHVKYLFFCAFILIFLAIQTFYLFPSVKI